MSGQLVHWSQAAGRTDADCGVIAEVRQRFTDDGCLLVPEYRCRGCDFWLLADPDGMVEVGLEDGIVGGPAPKVADALMTVDELMNVVALFGKDRTR